MPNKKPKPRVQYRDGTPPENVVERGVQRLTEFLTEHHDRKPTESEKKFVRRFVSRLRKKDGVRARAPTISELRNGLDLPPSPKQLKRWGIDDADSYRYST